MKLISSPSRLEIRKLYNIMISWNKTI